MYNFIVNNFASEKSNNSNTKFDFDRTNVVLQKLNTYSESGEINPNLQKLLSRSVDVLAQSSTEKLIEMLKENSGIKDCPDETIRYIDSVNLTL